MFSLSDLKYLHNIKIHCFYKKKYVDINKYNVTNKINKLIICERIGLLYNIRTQHLIQRHTRSIQIAN